MSVPLLHLVHESYLRVPKGSVNLTVFLPLIVNQKTGQGRLTATHFQK